MNKIIERIESVDWAAITKAMHTDGYALIPRLLSEKECEDLIANYNDPAAYRKTVAMERYRFGSGEYKYFSYPLPELIQTIRTVIYPKLAPMANTWFRELNMDMQFPSEHAEFLRQCHESGQEKATPLILKYGKGGFNTLHQDLYGAVYFPIQLVFLLNEPDKDFSGGEFVMTQQIPRAQSKVTVIRQNKGDGVLFPTNFRPEKGIKCYCRVKMKHGVSEIKSGERHTLGIIFHDAAS